MTATNTKYSDKQAHLVKRGENINGGIYEIWRIGDGRGIWVGGILVDFTNQETMAFTYDLRRHAVKTWDELGVWHEDATGGKAIRELGYEPV